LVEEYWDFVPGSKLGSRRKVFCISSQVHRCPKSILTYPILKGDSGSPTKSWMPLVIFNSCRIVMPPSTCGMGGVHLSKGSSSAITPSSTNFSVNAAWKFFATLPMSNSISVVSGAPSWDIPVVPAHSSPSGKTTAAETPIAPLFGRASSIAARSSVPMGADSFRS
jgi:hypothetical protein